MIPTDHTTTSAASQCSSVLMRWTWYRACRIACGKLKQLEKPAKVWECRAGTFPLSLTVGAIMHDCRPLLRRSCENH